MYTYSFVNSFYKMGLFTKDDVKLLLEVKQFSQDDYNKMFPEDSSLTAQLLAVGGRQFEFKEVTICTHYQDTHGVSWPHYQV